MERHELGALRRMAAPGPYSAREFEILSGFVYPPRIYTPEESAYLAEHAAAYAAKETASAQWKEAYAAMRQAEIASDAAGANERMAGQTEQQTELIRIWHAAQDVELERREACDYAAALEIAARPRPMRSLPTRARRDSIISRLRKAIAG